MKKILITTGSLFIMAFIILAFVNGNSSIQENKKAKTEVKIDAANSTDTTKCCHSSGSTCDPSKCKEMKCEIKDGKCVPSISKNNGENSSKESKDCCKKSAEVK